MTCSSIVTVSSRLGSQSVSCLTSRQALLMFLESVPDPSEQRSVLQTLRSLTCKGRKQDKTLPLCLTCLHPSGSPFNVRALLYVPVSSLDSVHAFNAFQRALQQSDVQTFGLVPGAEPQMAGRTGGSQSGVGLSVWVEMENTSS